MTKTKRRFKKFLIFLSIFVLVLLFSFGIFWSSLSNVNSPKEWNVYVKSNVINTLNNEYNQSTEKMYCVDGTIDTKNKKVTISTITPIDMAYSNKNEAGSAELFPCKGKLGMIHTHSKVFGIVPQCLFSKIDIFSLGALYGENRVFLGGVYCDKDRMVFYLTGSDTLGNLFLDNSRIGYTKIE